ncbi:helix-turn-helix domain-containing protein [Bosea sp. NBC_00550]|uniref:helix-turn-helix domain-containing protein n=1 Tax=Bosea sp. NBC_00550 TaxID=2969621 RepID=UPI00223021EC|nr:helix-turn-helix transcriptional regulator [Bosea sp. NBC_00550]UZF93184.1 helix-turn-helix transcriptional regulator [Bosea sp. NBC_00550]
MSKDTVKGAPRQFVRAWRVYRKLSQEALADRLGVTHGLISQIERGITGLTHDRIESLAEALGCAPADILSGPPRSPARLSAGARMRTAAAPAEEPDPIVEAFSRLLPHLPEARRQRFLADLQDAARLEGLEEPAPAPRAGARKTSE